MSREQQIMDTIAALEREVQALKRYSHKPIDQGEIYRRLDAIEARLSHPHTPRQEIVTNYGT